MADIFRRFRATLKKKSSPKKNKEPKRDFPKKQSSQTKTDEIYSYVLPNTKQNVLPVIERRTSPLIRSPVGRKIDPIVREINSEEKFRLKTPENSFRQENRLESFSRNSKLIRFPTRQRSTMKNVLPVEQWKFDSPIEKVFVTDSIPKGLALKINDSIERDRFGKFRRTQHFLDEPFQENQRPAFRFIRELNPDNSIFDSAPTENYSFQQFLPPVYYTACASADDPMRFFV